MGDVGIEHVAPWIALVTCAAVVTTVGAVAWRTWRLWRRARVTQQAASALLAVHRDRLDASIAALSDGAARFADDGEELATALAELREDVEQLRSMLARIPEERERLVQELGELVLPSGPSRSGHGDAGR